MDKLRVLVFVLWVFNLNLANGFRTEYYIEATEGDNVTLVSQRTITPKKDIRWKFDSANGNHYWVGNLGNPPNCRLQKTSRSIPSVTRDRHAINCTAIMLPNITLEDVGVFNAMNLYDQPEYFYLTVHNRSSDVSSSATTPFVWNRYILGLFFALPFIYI